MFIAQMEHVRGHVDKKVINKLQCRFVIQGDFNGLEKWADSSHDVQKDKCKVLHLGRYKSMHKCRLGTGCPEISLGEKVWG